jgi:hypothetical protein
MRSKNAIGYLTGHLAADAGCFFAYTRKEKSTPTHFYYTEWRNSITSSYQPVYSNPFGFIREKKSAQRLYDKKLIRPFTLPEFGSLCQHLYDSRIFTGLVILILEASIASLLFMPGGFAIAMETLADLVSEPSKEKLAPIKTPSLSKKVRQGCIDVINKECAGMSEEDIKVLLGRIENINKVKNKARLRNDFLHGRTPDITGAGDERTEERADLDMYYAAMRFYTLLNRLILKWIGYDNYVLNHAKIQENATKIKLREPYYLKD